MHVSQLMQIDMSILSGALCHLWLRSCEAMRSGRVESPMGGATYTPVPGRPAACAAVDGSAGPSVLSRLPTVPASGGPGVEARVPVRRLVHQAPSAHDRARSRRTGAPEHGHEP